MYEFFYETFSSYILVHEMGIRREEKFIQIKSVIQEVKSNCRHGRLDSWEIDYVARKHTFLASFRKFFLSSITDVTRKKKKK